MTEKWLNNLLFLQIHKCVTDDLDTEQSTEHISLCVTGELSILEKSVFFHNERSAQHRGDFSILT